jgi:APA family basic amino acid/polyamine antiporter
MTSSSKKQLNLFDLTMIVIGLVIGMGIFRTASDSARAAITPNVFFISWVVGGFIALCGALTYAEIGSRYPITGGYYKIFATCYHPSIAFAINCIILISNAASLSGVALIGSEYICEIIFSNTPSDLIKSLVAMSAIVLFYGINLLGLRMSSTTQNILMLIKISMILLIVAAIFFPSTATSNLSFVPTGEFTMMDYIKSFGMALVAVSFTYGGYQQTINFGEEVKNPQKNLPRGIFIGIVVIILLYLSVSFAYYNVIGFEELKNAKGIAAIVAERMFGPTGRFAFSILLFIAVLAYVNVLLLSNPRVMFAMSEDGILPKVFSKKDEKRDVLTVSLTVYALLSVVVLFFADTFDKILSFTIFLDSIGMAFSAATIFIIRKKTSHLDKSQIYSMKFFPIMPVIFILAYLFVATSIAIDKPETAITATAVLAGFLILYFITNKRKKPA